MGLICSSTSNRSLTALRVKSGLKWLHRRGPDAQSIWLSQDQQVALGFARLAIVDPSAVSHQPMVSRDDTHVLVFNGEIYNYAELRQELRSVAFETQSDTEVLLASYREWGLDGLKRLRGMFAGAIVDRAIKRIFIFRDPVGKKPLFVATSHQGVAFGSSVLALRAAGVGDSSWDDEALKQYWEHGWVGPDRSIMRDCRTVLPGEILEFDWESRLQSRHSCQPTVTSTSSFQKPSDVSEQCHELLKQSVRRRLTNNPAPVSLLSGGIDSTVITKLMLEVGKGSAITLGSRLRLSPDEKYAEQAASRMGISLEKVRLAGGEIGNKTKWAMELQDEPLGMISFFMLAGLVEAAKEHGRILLTGDGGDEVFLGYGKQSDWVLPGNGHPGSKMDGSPLPTWMSPWGKWIVQEQLLGHMLTKVDRAASEQGVEIRCPLLDWDLIAFMRSLTAEQTFVKGRMKGLLKAELDGWPDSFIERPKVGFTFRLRWFWLVSNFRGLREQVDMHSCEPFHHLIPNCLRKESQHWDRYSIWKNFSLVWRLMAWSSFVKRMDAAKLDALDSVALTNESF